MSDEDDGPDPELAADPEPKRGRGRPKGTVGRTTGRDRPGHLANRRALSKARALQAKFIEQIHVGVEGRPFSVRDALTPQQRKFCQLVASAIPKAQAWRMANDIDETDRQSRDMTRSGAESHRWFCDPLIVAYMQELNATPGQSARLVLSQQVKLGDGAEAKRAADRILEEEDRLGFRDGAVLWAEHLCAVGAEVVIPFPTTVRGQVSCPCGCDHLFEVELPIQATTPFADLFPQFAPVPEETPGAA